MTLSTYSWGGSDLRQTFLVPLLRLGIKAFRNSFRIITFRTAATSTITLPSTPPPPPNFITSPLTTTKMTASTHNLESTLSQLRARPLPSNVASLLTTAKHELLALNAMVPTPSTPPALLSLARTTLESGALCSIRLQDPTAFTKYFDQLSPFYALPASSFHPAGPGERAKITGLYLLLLLTRGDYAGFHCVLEGLEMESGEEGKLEGDPYIGYPVRLERWLMEGSYDRVWKATKGGVGVPGEEEGVFSEVCGFYLLTLVLCLRFRTLCFLISFMSDGQA